MKLIVEQSHQTSEVEIIIKCGVSDARVDKLVNIIRLFAFSIPAKKDGAEHMLSPEEVLYIESVDENTFLYTADEVYSAPMKLYELENLLVSTSFVRISKSSIVNTAQLNGVRAMLNGKFEVTLSNDEKIIVNRHYVPGFKNKFGL